MGNKREAHLTSSSVSQTPWLSRTEARGARASGGIPSGNDLDRRQSVRHTTHPGIGWRGDARNQELRTRDGQDYAAAFGDQYDLKRFCPSP